MSSSEMPLLPRELERDIFSKCAASFPLMRPALIQVAARVRTWIEPTLYHHIFVCDGHRKRETGPVNKGSYADMPIDDFLYRHAHPASWTILERHTRSIAIDARTACTPELVKALSALPKLTAVCMLSTTGLKPTLLPALTALGGLERLSMDVAPLFRDSRQTQTPRFTHPVFRHITHLHLDIFAPDWDAWARYPVELGTHPHLTHLALGRVAECIGDYDSIEAYEALVADILRECARLTVLVFLCADGDELEFCQEELGSILSEDARSVLLLLEWSELWDDWKRSVCCMEEEEEDFWARCETWAQSRLECEGMDGSEFTVPALLRDQLIMP
ncbi:unnamed protein product [Mycena citricolor]|uniref:Uncharacterized protein n=1 Tax=Mycena citricolor TaxID=2018698 RepID=A0AAD2H4Z8_9AGAR|nr:unnamed protein product [Mycena citricolor]